MLMELLMAGCSFMKTNGMGVCLTSHEFCSPAKLHIKVAQVPRLSKLKSAQFYTFIPLQWPIMSAALYILEKNIQADLEFWGKIGSYQSIYKCILCV